MKKFTSILLTLSVLLSTAAFADEAIELISDTTEETSVELISEDALEVPSNDVEKTVVTGTVKAVTDTQIELDDYVLNISDYTYKGDYSFNPVDEIKAGDEVYAIISTAQTMSIPPQSYAFYVLVKTEEAQLPPIFTTVGSVADGVINSADGNYEITFEGADTSMFKVRSIIQPQDLTSGSEIVFYSDVMTMSIPALANPSRILVLNVAGADEVAYLQENDILLGTDKGLELTREVTRAEAVTFLSRISPVARIAYTSDFTDVTEAHWAYNTISWASATGIAIGTGEGKFSPDETVSGRQFVKMLLSMKGDSEVTIENAFDKGLDAGIITRATAAKVDTDADLTRNDVSILLYNAIEK